jgi:hypothetical protein
VIHLTVGVGVGDINAIGGQKQETITRKASSRIPVGCERQNPAIPSCLGDVRCLAIEAVAHSHSIRVTGLRDCKLNTSLNLVRIEPSADEQVALRLLLWFTCGFHGGVEKRLTTRAQPRGTKRCEPRSGTECANPGWLQRFVRLQNHVTESCTTLRLKRNLQKHPAMLNTPPATKHRTAERRVVTASVSPASISPGGATLHFQMPNNITHTPAMATTLPIVFKLRELFMACESGLTTQAQRPGLKEAQSET